MDKEKFCVQRKNSVVSTVYTATHLKYETFPKLKKGHVFRISSGLVLMFLAISTLIYTPFDFIMNERLRMTPGLPAYEWWAEPPDIVHLKVYIFNVTNSEEFLSGRDTVLKFEEVGPVVYLEKLRHTDIVFNENSTLSYTAERTPILLPELSNLSYSDVIIVPNMAILSGASYVADSSFVLKMGFNMLIGRVKSPIFSKLTVYEYLWNWTDPLVTLGKTYFPNIVPIDNIGVLDNIYSDFVDRVTIHIGTANPKNFFLIDRFRGSNRLGKWEGIKCDNCQGSTEGLCYPQFLTREDTVVYLRKTICRVAPLYYTGDLVYNGISAYRWDLPLDFYHRPKNTSEPDCYTRPGDKTLPSGISDVSPCWYNFPIAASLPHFLGAVANATPKVEGMSPFIDAHESYAIIEPYSGIPLESRARSQSNLVVKKLSGLKSQIMLFSDMILPMFWLEYGQQGLPWYVSYTMYFTVVILPKIQYLISSAILFSGCYLIVSGGFPYFIYVSRQFRFKYYNFEKLSR